MRYAGKMLDNCWANVDLESKHDDEVQATRQMHEYMIPGHRD